MRAAAALTVLAAAGLLTSGCSSDVDRPVEAHVLVAPEAASPPAGEVSAGRALYVTSCAACHGDSGTGGFGPSLRSSLVAADFDALLTQIREGQGAMPAFGGVLTEEQIDDVGAYVSARIAQVGEKPLAPVPPPETGQSPTAAPPSIDVSAGAEIFAQTCASCHGPDGQGTDLAPALPTDLGFADAKRVVLGGAEGMPAFAEFLGAREVDQVTAYVVSELAAQAASRPRGQQPGGESAPRH